ncbi:MAG TPA: hypothetical protein VGD35_13300, partial [Chitinophaga sp.]
RSYWTDLCRDIIGKEIQHNPTKGGQQEASKYLDFYEQTLALYQSKFGIVPPEDIWPNGKARFSDIDFVRVNKRTNWVVPKPEPDHKWFAIKLFIVFVLTMVCFKEASAGWKPFTIAVGIIAIVGMLLFRFGQEPDDPRKRASDSAGGCSSGCSSGDGHGHGHGDGDSGCSSGCSGCSGSGCSGCGGGGGD